VEALTAEAMAAEAMPLIQAHCQAGPREKRAVIFSVRVASAATHSRPNMRRVSVAADDPVTMRCPAGGGTRRIFDPD
jgi:hypothetical protein